MSLVPSSSTGWGWDDYREFGQEYMRRRRIKVQQRAMDEQTQDWSNRRRRARSDEGIGRTPQGPRQLPSVLPPKKMPRVTAVNKLVDKSSMKIRGKRKLKKIKNVKVSKALTKKIKKVIAGTEATGSYTTVKGGFVGAVLNTPSATNADPNKRVLGNVIQTGGLSQSALVGPSVNEPAGSRTLWAALNQWNPNPTTLAAADTYADLIQGTDFNFFTIEKILDAASVIFNRKAISQQPWLLTNNLNTIFNPSTGQPISNQIGSLKIHLANSWVQFTLRNMSGRIVHLDIFECTPRIKFDVFTPLQGLASTLETGSQNVQDVDLAQDANFRYYNRLAPGSGVEGYKFGLLTEGTIDPSQIAKQFGWNWNVVKREMVLQPYETCVHSIKGPSGVLDWSKLSTNETDQVGFLKGFSVGCFMAVRGDQALPTTKTSGAKYADSAPVPATAERWSYQMSMPVAVEIKESYSIKVPEVAGFVSGSAGSRQQLNMRKRKIVYANFLDKNGTQTFQVANEQNPQRVYDNDGNDVAPVL